MSLNTLHIALQGLFPLSAIGAAVQGLIAQIQKERQENNIGGGLKRPAGTKSAATQRPIYTDADIERLVREKWELIDQQRAQAKPVDAVKAQPAIKLQADHATSQMSEPGKPVAISLPAKFIPEPAAPEAKSKPDTRGDADDAMALILVEALLT
jgi:hypothetical protein